MLEYDRGEEKSAMSKKGTQALEEALSLPPSERAEVIDILLASLDSCPDRKIDELWGQEAEDRIDAFDRGEIKAIPASEVFNAIKKVNLLEPIGYF